MGELDLSLDAIVNGELALFVRSCFLADAATDGELRYSAMGANFSRASTEENEVGVWPRENVEGLTNASK